ncbi:GNAT family N-acetyltransferase [Phocicoccus pinnipedialis]|uniref:N-acetyltransferase domain-containing protein n=1 Tax=Phocicoccus pinnipedialis TaxID=110845 RepID=A0A6V7R4Q7_9BACL|nr:GNAT family N-acetyltransferase [Jeotgalicoccus pinnipedialis]MBP1940009.1 putative acetyltransferase [Jeotgalicoccus pinnipedialis]CAD2072043.1 hypothetical protein JEOPIN946_00241 [Jeotgalicoccus pinnipedialis]
MILRELTILDEDRFRKYIKDWSDEKIVPSNNTPSRYESFEEMITILALDKTTKDAHWIPAMTLFLFHDDEILGSVNIRFKLNTHLEKIGGHIGYGVNPSYRGNGYGNFMVREALKYLNSHNVFEVLLTCDEDNYASKKIILNAGGVESKDYGHDGKVTKRFFINNERPKDRF